MRIHTKPQGIIIVAAGVMQIPAVLTAKKLGLFVMATDGNPNAAAFKFCDLPVVIDTKDIAGHVKLALENQERYNIKGAFAAADVAVTVAAITTALGLNGIPQDVAERSHNKALMKERWLRDGIPTALAMEVSTLKEAQAALRKIGLPAIVKAIDNAASRGSKKIVREDELAEALENAKQASTTKSALIEQYVTGYEQSVESIVWNNRHYHCGMADRQFGFHPYHIETAHVDPSALPEETQRRIYKVVDAAADSLGIDFGPAKADMIMTEKGPMILEMPARLSGGFHSQYTTPLSTGLDPIRAVIEISLGRKLDESLITPRKSNVAICSGIFPPAGRLKAVHGVEEAKTIEGVAQVIITKKPGDVIEPLIDNGKRVCWVITVGKTQRDAEAIFQQANRAIHFEVEPIS
jgi:biotin carboxylase